MRYGIAGSLAAILAASVPVSAVPQAQERVARLSHVEGHVSFQHAGDPDWNAASMNMALMPADRIYTGNDGRAEIQIDDGSVLRLAERTDVEILSLREDLVQFRLLVGLASLTTRSSIPFEISTPAASFSTLRPGAYRFDVLENGDSDAIVRKGVLSAANDRFAQQVDSGELIHVTAGLQGSHVLSRYDQRDAWDEWNDRRDADFTAYDSRKYLPEYVYAGASDLDRHGRWVVFDSYGPAWVPLYVDTGWSPYWHGRWHHRPSWGWTWVSYEPWGWLPYHYGSWHFNASFGWGWIPGPSFSFHFWSPGRVRFYHGPGGISWCPLGPGDYYNVNNYFFRHSYGYHLTHLRLTQHRGPHDLANLGAPGALKTLPLDEFINGNPEGRARLARDGSGLLDPERTRMVTDRLEIQPGDRGAAPLPGRAAVRPPDQRGRPTVVRTMPAGEPGNQSRLLRTADREGIARSPALRSGEIGRAAQPERNRGAGIVSGSRTPAAAAPPSRSLDSGTQARSRVSPSGNESSDPRSRGRVYSITPNARQAAPAPAESGAVGRNPAREQSQRPSVRTDQIGADVRSGAGNAGSAERSRSQAAPARTYQPPTPPRAPEQVNPRSRGRQTVPATPVRPPAASRSWSSDSRVSTTPSPAPRSTGAVERRSPVSTWSNFTRTAPSDTGRVMQAPRSSPARAMERPISRPGSGPSSVSRQQSISPGASRMPARPSVSGARPSASGARPEGGSPRTPAQPRRPPQ